MGSTPTSIRCLYAISIWILIYSYIDLLWFLFVPSTQIALRQQHPNDAQWNIRQSTQHSNAVWNPINWLYKGHLERIPMKWSFSFLNVFPGISDVTRSCAIATSHGWLITCTANRWKRQGSDANHRAGCRGVASLSFGTKSHAAAVNSNAKPPIPTLGD